MSLSTTQRFPSPLSTFVPRLPILHADFFFSPLPISPSLSFFTRTSKLSESFLRGNVPIFPVFLEEEEDRRLAKERGRSTDEE